jgi:hypothetical protein
MDSNKIFPSSAQSIPAADVQLKGDASEVLTSTRTYPVKQPNEDANDFMIEIRASVLNRIRGELDSAKDEKFQWHEVCLALSTAFCGATLGGLGGALPLVVNGTASRTGVLFYIVFPVLSVFFGVFYYFKRREDNICASKLAAAMLKQLPDPLDTTERKLP